MKQCKHQSFRKKSKHCILINIILFLLKFTQSYPFVSNDLKILIQAFGKLNSHSAAKTDPLGTRKRPYRVYEG